MTKKYSLEDRKFNPLVSPSPASHNNTITLFDSLIVSLASNIDTEVMQIMIKNENATAQQLIIAKAYRILKERMSFINFLENSIVNESN